MSYHAQRQSVALGQEQEEVDSIIFFCSVKDRMCNVSLILEHEHTRTEHNRKLLSYNVLQYLLSFYTKSYKKNPACKSSAKQVHLTSMIVNSEEAQGKHFEEMGSF